MSGIDDFLGAGARTSRAQEFEKLSQGKSKDEVRELEMALLTPEELPEYVGEERRYVVNSETSVKFVFASKEEMDFFGEFIPIAVYQEKSITDIKIILDLFRAMKSGKIEYNKKAGEFCLVNTKPAPEEKLIDEPKQEKEDNAKPAGKFFRRK